MYTLLEFCKSYSFVPLGARIGRLALDLLNLRLRSQVDRLDCCTDQAAAFSPVYSHLS